MTEWFVKFWDKMMDVITDSRWRGLVISLSLSAALLLIVGNVYGLQAKYERERQAPSPVRTMSETERARQDAWRQEIIEDWDRKGEAGPPGPVGPPGECGPLCGPSASYNPYDVNRGLEPYVKPRLGDR